VQVTLPFASVSWRPRRLVQCDLPGTANHPRRCAGRSQSVSRQSCARRLSASEAPSSATSSRCSGKPAFGGSMLQRGSLRKVPALAVLWDSFLCRLFRQPPLSLLLFGRAFGTTGPSWRNPHAVAAVTLHLLPLARRWPQSENAVLK
jgi:hypothetical protein